MSKIYLVGDEKYSFEHTCKALSKDVAFFQLRLKDVDDEEFLKEALKYKKVCFEKGIKLIINDNLKVAKEVDADGIHVGQDDVSVTECKKEFPNKIIGLSCGSLDEAKEAFLLGVDYIGVGAMYETSTKKDATVIGMEKLKEIVDIATCEVVAIGGIDSSNFQVIYDAGADYIAVSSAVLGAEKPQEIVKVLKG